MANPNDLSSFCNDISTGLSNSATTYCKDYYTPRCPRTCTYALETTEKLILLEIPEKQRTPQQAKRLEYLMTSTSLML